MDKDKAKAWNSAHQRPSQNCPSTCDGKGCYDQQIKVRGVNGEIDLAWASRCKTIMKRQRMAKLW